MKILISTFWTFPHTGGINTYINILKSELEKTGNEVDIFAHHPSFKYYYLVGKQELRIDKALLWKQIFPYIQTYYTSLFPQLDPWIIEMEAEKYSFELACSSLNLDEYHIIHVQDVISSAAISRIKPHHVPLISTIHGWFANEYYLDHPNSGKGTLAWIYNQYIEHCGLTNSQLTLLPSKWLRDIYINDLHIPPAQLIHVPYGIETDSFTTVAIDSVEPHSPDLLVLSCVARLVPVKGHKYLMEALCLLKNERNDWICYFIGDGPLREELELLSIKLGIEKHLKFVGARDDVQYWLQQSDIIVLTSIQDNQPFVVMEAQMSGKPVIVTEAGGMPEMVEHEKTGLIAKKASPESIYSSIKMLMENEELRIKIGNSGQKWAFDKWSVDNMLELVHSVYTQITLKKGEENFMKVKNAPDKVSTIKSVYPYLNENFLNDKDLEIWKKIIPHLPKEYIVPDPNIVKLIQKSNT
ncbi:GDP-mannose-dependent alpha-(1-6)-phosphatidylinositol monomannoside mannosyltransferase [compost metagenome]